MHMSHQQVINHYTYQAHQLSRAPHQNCKALANDYHRSQGLLQIQSDLLGKTQLKNSRHKYLPRFSRSGLRPNIASMSCNVVFQKLMSYLGTSSYFRCYHQICKPLRKLEQGKILNEYTLISHHPTQFVICHLDPNLYRTQVQDIQL